MTTTAPRGRAKGPRNDIMLYFDGYGLLTPVEPDDTYILWIVQQGSDGRLHDIVTKDREHFYYC